MQEALVSQSVNPSEAANTRASVPLPKKGAEAKLVAHESSGLTSKIPNPTTSRLRSARTQLSGPQVVGQYRLALEARKALVVSGKSVSTTQTAGRSVFEEADHVGEETDRDESVTLHLNGPNANRGLSTRRQDFTTLKTSTADSTLRLANSSIRGIVSTASANPITIRREQQRMREALSLEHTCS